MSFPFESSSRSASVIIQNARSRARATSSWEEREIATAPSSHLVIGIDFGTTYTGVAYAHSTATDTRDVTRTQEQLEAIVDKVVVIKTWPMANNQTNEKTPTILSYSPGNDEPTAWGGKVKLSHPTRIEHFKLGLQEGAGKYYRSRDDTHSAISLLGGFLDNHNWRHPDLPNKSALDFATDYLRNIRDYVIHQTLPRQLGQDYRQREQISYALTVPAIWNYKARDLTKQAAVRAGIPIDRLEIIPEPEAAALYCATTSSEGNLREGDRFLICDAGGGTVVVSCSVGSDIRISYRMKWLDAILFC